MYKIKTKPVDWKPSLKDFLFKGLNITPTRTDGIIYKRTTECGLCEGKGVIEEILHDCGDHTGYNSIAYPTGNLVTCPDCQ